MFRLIMPLLLMPVKSSRIRLRLRSTHRGPQREQREADGIQDQVYSFEAELWREDGPDLQQSFI